MLKTILRNCILIPCSHKHTAKYRPAKHTLMGGACDHPQMLPCQRKSLTVLERINIWIKCATNMPKTLQTHALK